MSSRPASSRRPRSSERPCRILRKLRSYVAANGRVCDRARTADGGSRSVARKVQRILRLRSAGKRGAAFSRIASVKRDCMSKFVVEVEQEDDGQWIGDVTVVPGAMA